MKMIKRILLINSFSELFHWSKIKELFLHYKEIILYIFFGVVTTVVNWIVYALMVKVTNVDLASVNGTDMFSLITGAGSGSSAILALFLSNIVAWVAGVLVAFVTNKIWVFESRVHSFAGILKEFFLFFASRILTGILEWFGLPLAVMLGMNQTLFGVQGFLAKVIISVVVVILNYVFSKLIVFRGKRSNKS